MKSKQLLFSITKNDLIVQTFCSGGKGGQNQNKVESGVRIIHPISGAVAESREQRSQLQNKRIAFKRLVETKEFKVWHKIKAASVLQGIHDIDREVEEQMQPKYLKIETYVPV